LRALFLLLLLANLLFLAWSQWIVRPASVPAAQVASGGRLVLASEAPAAAPLPALRLDTDASCVTLGPFLDLTEAARASARLREAGLGPRQRAAERAAPADPCRAEQRETAACDHLEANHGTGPDHPPGTRERLASRHLGKLSRCTAPVHCAGFAPRARKTRRFEGPIR